MQKMLKGRKIVNDTLLLILSRLSVELDLLRKGRSNQCVPKTRPPPANATANSPLPFTILSKILRDVSVQLPSMTINSYHPL
jgi:hypothetical protein